MTAAPSPPAPTDVERWLSEDGWLVELLLPRTDTGVLVQVLVLAVLAGFLLRPARRTGLLQLWLGVVVLTCGLVLLRTVH